MNKKVKKMGFCLFYAIVLVLIPAWRVFALSTGRIGDPVLHYLTLYVIFVSPLLFPVFYMLAKLENKKEKLRFVLFGFVLPFMIVIYWGVRDFQENFHPFG